MVHESMGASALVDKVLGSISKCLGLMVMRREELGEPHFILPVPTQQ